MLIVLYNIPAQINSRGCHRRIILMVVNVLGRINYYRNIKRIINMFKTICKPQLCFKIQR